MEPLSVGTGKERDLILIMYRGNRHCWVHWRPFRWLLNAGQKSIPLSGKLALAVLLGKKLLVLTSAVELPNTNTAGFSSLAEPHSRVRNMAKRNSTAELETRRRVKVLQNHLSLPWSVKQILNPIFLFEFLLQECTTSNKINKVPCRTWRSSTFISKL